MNESILLCMKFCLNSCFTYLIRIVDGLICLNENVALVFGD